MRLKIIPLTLRQLNDLVVMHHRNHKPVRGHRFSLGVIDGDGNVNWLRGRTTFRKRNWDPFPIPTGSSRRRFSNTSWMETDIPGGITDIWAERFE